MWKDEGHVKRSGLGTVLAIDGFGVGEVEVGSDGDEGSVGVGIAVVEVVERAVVEPVVASEVSGGRVELPAAVGTTTETNPTRSRRGRRGAGSRW